jgi:hypothetical protein
MTDYKNSAFYKVRQWAIRELYDSGVLTESNYSESSPIIPIQQIPESFDNTSWGDAGLPIDAPFIVYDVITAGDYDTAFWICRDEVSMWIYDYDIEKIFEIKDLLYDIFRRYDLSAMDVNEFNYPDCPYRFQYFEIMSGLPTDESDRILGRSGINLVISYTYGRELGENGRFA